MKLALLIEYDGTHYHGFQRQKNVTSIQVVLEEALSRVADHPVQLFCAGRTDAGVHARGQVVHFETTATRARQAWTLGVNGHLPRDISVRMASVVNDGFHARFSALARRYRYTIDNQMFSPAIMRDYVAWYPKKLDEENMQKAAEYLLGEHDFSAFRGSGCQAKTPNRCIERLTVSREGTHVIVDIQANAFLHHMVRNIVGVLVQVGTGKRDAVWVKGVLDTCDRRQAGVTMPPSGLCFEEVIYSSSPF